MRRMRHEKFMPMLKSQIELFDESFHIAAGANFEEVQKIWISIKNNYLTKQMVKTLFGHLDCLKVLLFSEFQLFESCILNLNHVLIYITGTSQLLLPNSVLNEEIMDNIMI